MFGVVFIRRVTPWFEARTMASLRAFTFFMSTPIGPPTVTPKSPARRAT